uniref:hypothetical protein n=1 Tax=uncultured Erythrobacter sp. TaxID=263913 RepID=UPI00260F5DCC|nr:hypothetical protein [uncultured Erythrobacter sp.]
MSYTDQTAPTLPDFYLAGLLASALAYIGILLLFAFSMAVDTASAGTAFGVIIVGGIYMFLPALLIAFLITAPLGCAIGIAMLKLFEPGPWQGAVNGALTALIILVALAMLIGAGPIEFPPPEVTAFTLGLIGIGAASGWVGQSKCINWPEAAD